MNLLRFLPLLLLLCGCAREVSPVSALALDCKNGVYCLTAEVVRQDSPDAGSLVFQQGFHFQHLALGQ